MIGGGLLKRQKPSTGALCKHMRGIFRSAAGAYKARTDARRAIITKMKKYVFVRRQREINRVFCRLWLPLFIACRNFCAICTSEYFPELKQAVFRGWFIAATVAQAINPTKRSNCKLPGGEKSHKQHKNLGFFAIYAVFQTHKLSKK